MHRFAKLLVVFSLSTVRQHRLMGIYRSLRAFLLVRLQIGFLQIEFMIIEKNYKDKNKFIHIITKNQEEFVKIA